MSRLSVIVILVGIVLMCTYAQELYIDKYDDIDFLGILNNDRLRERYYKCFMGLEPCATEDAKFFKVILGEALVSKCKRCTEKQKVILDQSIDWFIKNKPDDWEKLVTKTLEDLRNKNAN
ncbi:CspE1 [Eciton burchellii]|nr:CspE1 [Eciton burchellii]